MYTIHISKGKTLDKNLFQNYQIKFEKIYVAFKQYSIL